MGGVLGLRASGLALGSFPKHLNPKLEAPFQGTQKKKGNKRRFRRPAEAKVRRVKGSGSLGFGVYLGFRERVQGYQKDLYSGI